MPTKKDCDGCHGRKAAAITAAEAAIAGAEERIRDATRRIGICEDTAEILDPLARRLHAALQALRQVPHDLGEVYELIYAVHPPRREDAPPRQVDRGSAGLKPAGQDRQGPGRAPASHDFRARPPAQPGRHPPPATRRVHRGGTRRVAAASTRRERDRRSSRITGASDDGCAPGAPGRSRTGRAGTRSAVRVRCRQARHRFLRAAGQAGPVAGGRPLRLAYADPPYPGKAWLYRGHPDYAGEVDHAALIRRLAGYDGWALSTSAEALPGVLALCPPGVRVAAWHRGERPTASRWPLHAWEPVIYAGGRQIIR